VTNNQVMSVLMLGLSDVRCLKPRWWVS